jgi:hypothetical protein
LQDFFIKAAQGPFRLVVVVDEERPAGRASEIAEFIRVQGMKGMAAGRTDGG